MAQLRVADRLSGTGVPVELLDPQNLTWRDPAAFHAWCQRHGVEHLALLDLVTWADRFPRAANAWAVHNGITMPRSPVVADRTRLRALGVPHVGALDKARALAESR